MLFIALNFLHTVIAVAFILHTGCRPSEAAFVVQHRTIKKNDYTIKHATFNERATAPKEITKTKRDYFWLLCDDLSPFSHKIKQHRATGFDDY